LRRSESVRAIAWSPRLLGIIVLTAFGSTYLGIWLQQTALKFSPVGIAQTLTATSPLFVLPIAAMMGDKISMRAIFGVAIALAGIWILFQ
jgi:drug/metabolite transporter (DMT)-like permease